MSVCDMTTEAEAMPTVEELAAAIGRIIREPIVGLSSLMTTEEAATNILAALREKPCIGCGRPMSEHYGGTDPDVPAIRRECPEEP